MWSIFWGLGAQFFGTEGAITILIEGEEVLRGSIDFLCRDDVIVVGVDDADEWGGRAMGVGRFTFFLLGGSMVQPQRCAGEDGEGGLVCLFHLVEAVIVSAEEETRRL